MVREGRVAGKIAVQVRLRSDRPQIRQVGDVVVGAVVGCHCRRLPVLLRRVPGPAVSVIEAPVRMGAASFITTMRRGYLDRQVGTASYRITACFAVSSNGETQFYPKSWPFDFSAFPQCDTAVTEIARMRH